MILVHRARKCKRFASAPPGSLTSTKENDSRNESAIQKAEREMITRKREVKEAGVFMETVDEE